jgi:hypothetical protein
MTGIVQTPVFGDVVNVWAVVVGKNASQIRRSQLEEVKILTVGRYTPKVSSWQANDHDRRMNVYA